jgi:hypothetical protein
MPLDDVRLSNVRFQATPPNPQHDEEPPKRRKTFLSRLLSLFRDEQPPEEWDEERLWYWRIR